MHIRPKSLPVLLVGIPTLLVCVALAEVDQPRPLSAAPPPPKPTPAEIEAQKKAAEALKKAAEAQKKAMEAQKKEAMEAMKGKEAEVLKAAYILLGSANNNYEGHKGKAMHEVEAAMKRLDPDAMKAAQQRVKALEDLHKLVANKLLPKQGPEAHESQALSDAQVAHAGEMLGHVAGVLAANKQTKPLEHVENAIKEIRECPKHEGVDLALKGKEVDVLTTAYILLASANHDYDGHRAKAMSQVAEACKLLDRDLEKHGDVAQKIKAMKDAQAEAAEKIKAKEDATIHEVQSLSDAQLYLADSLIKRTRLVLVDGKQPKVTTCLENADVQIGLALKVR